MTVVGQFAGIKRCFQPANAAQEAPCQYQLLNDLTFAWCMHNGTTDISSRCKVIIFNKTVGVHANIATNDKYELNKKLTPCEITTITTLIFI